MTRREFIKSIIGIAMAALIGTKRIVETTMPQKFVRAFKVRRYPGSLRPSGDVLEQGKWSG